MTYRFKLLVLVSGTLLLVTGCSSAATTPSTPTAQVPPSPMERVIPPASTHTPFPTKTPVQPTQTVAPPTATVTQTPTPVRSEDSSAAEDVYTSLEGLSIDTFFEESYRLLLLRDPDRLFANGLAASYGVANDQFSDQSVAYLEETAEIEIAILELLRGYDQSTLTPDQQLSYDIYAWVLEDRLRGHKFMFHNFPVNSLTIWGKHNWLVDFMVNYHPIENAQDAEAYLARLAQIDTWTRQLLEGLELRAQMGIVPPKYILEGVIWQIETHVGRQSDGAYNPEATALYSSFRNKLAQLEGMGTDEKLALSHAARDELEATFIPAFLELRDYLQNLSETAGSEGGAWTLPDGEAFYAYALYHETSTGMTPEEIHELGLAELAHTQEQIQEAAAELGFTQDELEEHLAEASPLLQGNDLLAEFEQLVEKAHQASISSFGLYPQADLIIRPEPFGSLAYYLPPPFDGSAPGRFFVNLNRPTPRYLLPALTFHETIPGHHLQGALTRELEIPTFRKDIEFNAYVEGWALYAERLAWELGLYENDPLSNLGRLQFEEMRALRLVVDTGVHAKGWTWAEASARVEELTGSPNSREYLTRFFVLPGQASGYTIGMLKISELRQRAMDQLGDGFDLREFHHVILGNGPMPLEILERLVDEWIEDRIS